MANKVTRRARATARVIRDRIRPTGSARDGGAAWPAADLLEQSLLFDLDWYNLQLDRTTAPMSRREAVEHYLRQGRHNGRTPHPLVDPVLLAEGLEVDLEKRDSLVVYLRRRRWRLPTHALFQSDRYSAAYPEAREHPEGPLGHYIEVGAASGARANDWFPVDGEGRQPDMAAWVVARWQEWRAGRALAAPGWLPRPPAGEEAFRDRFTGVVPTAQGDGPCVSVVILGGYEAEHLAASLQSLAAQTLGDWEAFLVVEDASFAAGAEDHLPGHALTVLESAQQDGLQVAEAVRRATGDHVAFLAAGESWDPDRLRLLVAAAQASGADLTADAMKLEQRDGGVRFAKAGLPAGRVDTRNTIDVSRLLVRRPLLADAQVDWASEIWDFVLVADLAPLHAVEVLPFVGVTRDHVKWSEGRKPVRRWRRLRYPALDTLADVALHERLVDWSALAGSAGDDKVVSVIIPTYRDWRMTLGAVSALASTETDLEIECIVHDDGSDAHTAAMLDALAERFAMVRVLRSKVNRGYAMANDLALAESRGSVIVFLNNDTEVEPGWLTPLLSALEDPEVLGAQSLLLYPTGTVQSAGVAFPKCGGVPHEFLSGFPREDAERVRGLTFHALTGAALALRRVDAVAMRGFDPIFRNGMEDVDLCLRLAATRPGHFVVCPESVVVHLESRTEGRFRKARQNRSVFLERWRDRLPGDDVELWGALGLTVVDHEVRAGRTEVGPLALPTPLLVRTDRLPGAVSVAEAPPRLRWAIKNPAPAGLAGEHWGDTHFARAVAGALRELGQEVVIDARPEFARASARHDDVSLVLQGLAPYNPLPENINLVWLISHPERFHASSAQHFDRVLAASVSWSEETSRLWGRRIEPLLQATDPSLFHPDRAVPDTGHAVLFVGGSRRQHRPIVAAGVEQGLPLAVYGSEWASFIHKRYIQGTYLPNVDLGAAYRSAGYVLNDHWEDMRTSGFLSNRLFDAVAAGARVITDDVAGLGDLFGSAVQVMREPEDLVRLTSQVNPDEIFGDDTYRREVAARIAREHSFLARAERLIEIALEERKRRS